MMKRKSGRPKKTERELPTYKLRTMAWARCLKLAVLDDPDLTRPQGEKVVKEVRGRFKIDLSATQYFYWWKGAQSPSITALKSLENKGFVHNALFDGSSRSSYANRHFAILDSWVSFKNKEDFTESVHLNLSKLDEEWSPWNGRLGMLKRYRSEDDLLFSIFEVEGAEEDIANHYFRLGWDKKALYPGPRITEVFNEFYDPYNLSCLMVWLLAIAPICTFDDVEFERLAVDLATVTLCFRSIHSNLSGGRVNYRSSGLSGLIIALSSLFLDAEISPDIVADVLAYNDTDWPLASIGSNSDEMMISSVFRLRKAYHSWLSRNGSSVAEVLKFL